MKSFYCKSAIDINNARIKHFKSLNLNLNNLNVLEVGAGGKGDFTKMLLKKNVN